MTSLLNTSAETNEARDANPYDSTVSNLTKGILDIYGPPMLNVEKQLVELTMKQNFLITQIHDENLSFAQLQYSSELREMFDKLKLYNAKLVNIKKDMKTVYERSLKLKKRAERLQQAKMKVEQIRIKNEMELKREESLIGQPGSSS